MQELVVYQKWEDCTEYLFKCVIPQLPKSERYAMGSHLRNSTIEMGKSIARANNIRDTKFRKKEIENADLALCELKIMIRLAYRLKYIDLKKHEVSVRYLAELGKMLGGWLKSYASQG